MTSPDEISLSLAEEAWRTAARGFRSLIFGGRLAELRGDHHKRFNAQGLHPASVEYGRLLALQELMPQLRDNDFDPVREAKKARDAALRQFASDIAEKGVPDACADSDQSVA